MIKYICISNQRIKRKNKEHRIMGFYEIEMSGTPKILFACSAEFDHYKNQFHKRSSYLEIVVIEQGDVLYRFADGRTKTVSPQMLTPIVCDMDCDVFAHKGQHQRHTTIGLQLDYSYQYHMDISRFELSRICERIKENPRIFLLPYHEPLGEDYQPILHAIQKVIHYNASPNAVDKTRALGAFYSLAANLTDFVLQSFQSDRNSPSAVQYVKKAKDYIHSHYTEKIKISQIAEALNISEGYLHDLFQSVTGLSIIEYCNIYRVESAIQCMEGYNLTLKDAALQVGIDDACYMSRLFKKVTGISWREYQKVKSQIQTEYL